MIDEDSSFPIAPTPKPTKYDLEADAQRQEPGGFGAWLEKNPEPKLDELIAKFGRYDKITPHAWAEHNAMMDDWHRRYRLRNATPPAPKGI